MQSQDFLQSKDWVDFQRSLGREVLEYNQDGILAKVIKHSLPFGKSYFYIPRGPNIDFNQMQGGFKNPVNNFTRWLVNEAKKHKSIFIKAEPGLDNVAQSLVEAKFRKSKREIQPSKTVILDIADEELEIMGRMHHKTRYNIGVAEKHEIVVRESDDLDSFWKLLKKTTARDNFSSHQKEYYRKLLELKGDLRVDLFLAFKNNKPIAGALVGIFDNTGFYLHGASDYEHRSMMAPYLLHWRIIQDLKKKGIGHYDFWGIDANKWPGVTRFKLGWGGKTVEYPGSFDLAVSKFWSLVYKIFRKFK